MTTITRTTLKRKVLEHENSTESAKNLLHDNVATLIDLTLVLKQTHWNVVGPIFHSVHIQMDEIIETVRAASDEVAERIVTIGEAPDGRAIAAAEDSVLECVEPGFHQVAATISAIAGRIKTAIDQLRGAIAKLAELDPVSENLLIGINAQSEKHLWMVQAQKIS